MTFKPFHGYVEVEPMSVQGLASDEKSLLEMAKIVSIGEYIEGFNLKIGDIIFFRPHGFFTLPEHEGVIRHVVKMGDEFVLGVISNDK